MKILKTSQQAREEKARKEAAFQEMKHCPECGHEISLGLISLPIRSHDDMYVYRASCPSCRCEWESEEF